jgi:hypothetical protein
MGFGDDLYQRIKEILPKGMSLEKHNKCFSIRIKSGKIDRTKQFDSQLETIAKGLSNLELIRKWIKENELLLRN